MTNEDVLAVFREAGALLEGHFILSSGRRSPVFLQKALVFSQPDESATLCAALAKKLTEKFGKIDVVAGPAVGGIIPGYELARQLRCRSIFAERVDGQLQFRRGFSFEPGTRVLIVEDIVTTGGSVVEVIEAVEAWQGNIVGIGLLADRSGGKVDFGYRTEPLMELAIEAWQPDECPLCAQGMPFTERGSRKL